jgi:hypothetical protein
VVRKIIPQVLTFPTTSTTFSPLHTLDSLLDLILTTPTTSTTPESSQSDVVDYVLPYLVQKIRTTENLPVEVQDFVLWKLLTVSRDILANNEREQFMGIVDALMNGTNPPPLFLSFLTLFYRPLFSLFSLLLLSFIIKTNTYIAPVLQKGTRNSQNLSLFLLFLSNATIC